MVQIDTKFSKPHASSQQKQKEKEKKYSLTKSARLFMHPHSTQHKNFCAVSIHNISKIQFALQQMSGMLSQGRNDNKIG